MLGPPGLGSFKPVLYILNICPSSSRRAAIHERSSAHDRETDVVRLQVQGGDDQAAC